MSRINLLPDSFKIKSSIVKTSQLLKKIYIMLFVGTLVSAATSTGLFIMYKYRMDDAKERESSLIRQIEAMEETEQRLVLVKDRLKKVEQISKTKNANDQLEGINVLIDESDSYVTFEEAGAEHDLLDVKIKSRSTVDTFDFLEHVNGSEEFAFVTIESMEYLPGAGFQTEMLLKKK